MAKDDSVIVGDMVTDSIAELVKVMADENVIVTEGEADADTVPVSLAELDAQAVIVGEAVFETELDEADEPDTDIRAVPVPARTDDDTVDEAVADAEPDTEAEDVGLCELRVDTVDDGVPVVVLDIKPDDVGVLEGDLRELNVTLVVAVDDGDEDTETDAEAVVVAVALTVAVAIEGDAEFDTEAVTQTVTSDEEVDDGEADTTPESDVVEETEALAFVLTDCEAHDDKEGDRLDEALTRELRETV